jgi:uncharacterized protein (TIGR02145 family)
MNILRIIVLLTFPLIGISQAPQRINFQSVLRNTNGDIVSNRSVSLRISILSGSITGPAVYVETHSKTTDAGGLMNLQIGTGTAPSTDFSTINWGNSTHFIQLEADFSGGNSYVVMGAQELMSVPYALYATKTDTSVLNLTSRFSTKLNETDTSLLNLTTRFLTKLDSSDFPVGSTMGNIMFFDGSRWVILAPGAEGYSLKMSSGSPVWGSGTTSIVLAGPASSSLTLRLDSLMAIITHTTSNATGLGTTTGLPAGVTAALSGNRLTISGSPSASGTFNYAIPITGTSVSSDTARGTILVSACGSVSSVSDVDGNAYTSVSIGKQCWTVQNLRVRRYNDLTAIPFDATGSLIANIPIHYPGMSPTWQNLTKGAHTIYAHDSTATTPSNLSKYGYLYNWYAVKGISTAGVIAMNDTVNICPMDWHVPTDGEWTSLIQFLVPTETLSVGPVQSPTAGGKMKDTITALWYPPNNGATNESGFSALPGGFRFNVGNFADISSSTIFWSATEIYNDFALFRYLNTSSGNVGRDPNYKSVGAYVRCLRN